MAQKRDGPHIRTDRLQTSSAARRRKSASRLADGADSGYSDVVRR